MIKSSVKFLLKTLLVILIITFLPGLPPKSTFPFEEVRFQEPGSLEGPYALNTHLNDAERLFEGELAGPEHLLAKDGVIYASLASGEVVKIKGDKIEKFVQFGKPISGLLNDPIRGRPLGMNFDTIGDNLIVADAYYGIFEVDLKTGAKKQLIGADEIIDGIVPRKARLFNSVAVAKNGDIYWTDSSSDFGLDEHFFSLLLNPSGRLLHYSRAEGKSKLIADKLWFANGVALPSHEEFIVVNDLRCSRLKKCHLKGSKKGECEIFIEGLPGVTDNLTPDEDGIWLPLVVAAGPDHPMILNYFNELPYVRKFLTRLIMLLKMPFDLLQNTYPNQYTEFIIHQIRNLAGDMVLKIPRTTIVRIDWNGNVVDVLHGNDRSVYSISHVLEFGDHLYFGSPYNKFIGRAKFVNKLKVHPANTKNVSDKR